MESHGMLPSQSCLVHLLKGFGSGARAGGKEGGKEGGREVDVSAALGVWQELRALYPGQQTCRRAWEAVLEACVRDPMGVEPALKIVSVLFFLSPSFPSSLPPSLPPSLPACVGDPMEPALRFVSAPCSLLPSLPNLCVLIFHSPSLPPSLPPSFLQIEEMARSGWSPDRQYYLSLKKHLSLTIPPSLPSLPPPFPTDRGDGSLWLESGQAVLPPDDGPAGVRCRQS